VGLMKKRQRPFSIIQLTKSAFLFLSKFIYLKFSSATLTASTTKTEG